LVDEGEEVTHHELIGTHQAVSSQVTLWGHQIQESLHDIPQMVLNLGKFGEEEGHLVKELAVWRLIEFEVGSENEGEDGVLTEKILVFEQFRANLFLLA
jgi:hypothetical protein